MRACVMALALAAAGCTALRAPSDRGALRLTAEDERFAEALASYGRGLLFESEIGRAAPKTEEAFAHAAELDPGRERIQSRLALVALRQGRGDDAVAALEASCRANPRAVGPRLDLARTCQVLGRVDDAVRHYRLALQLDPDQPYVHITVARLLFTSGRDEEAIKALETAVAHPVSRQPVLAYCHSQGREFIVGDSRVRAVRCFAFLAKHADKGRARYCHVLAELLEDLGDDEGATRYFTQAVGEEDPLPDSYVKLGLIEARKDTARGIRRLEEAAARLPDKPLVLLTLAYLYSHEEQFERAIEMYERVEKVVTAGMDSELKPSFFLNYGSACERAGRFDRAEAVFEACLAKYPDAAQVLNYLAYMWAERGEKLDRALEYAERALKVEPENGAYLDTLGWVYYRKGDHPRALAEVQKAARAMPDDPVITDHLGDIEQALGNGEDALKHWRRSFLLDPDGAGVGEKLRKRGVDLGALRREARRLRKEREAAPPPVPAPREGEGAEEGGDTGAGKGVGP